MEFRSQNSECRMKNQKTNTYFLLAPGYWLLATGYWLLDSYLFWCLVPSIFSPLINEGGEVAGAKAVVDVYHSYSRSAGIEHSH
jgi:hypothetical protein